jgi:hypothetical protein
MLLTMEIDRRFFRIVLACYSPGEGHWSAREDLRANGLQDHQMCSLGSRRTLMADRDGSTAKPFIGMIYSGRLRCTLRRIRELEFHVSAVSLFDSLWPAPHHHDGSLTRWMTPSQSGVVWRNLCEGCALLMVSAESPQQQVKCSQIQLQHGPTVVQAFNFAV